MSLRPRIGIGCGAVGCGGLLFTVIVLAALSWFFVLKPAREFITNWQTSPAKTSSQPLPHSTSQQLSAPLTKAEVEKFVRIRRKVKASMGNTFTDLEQVWANIQNGTNPNVLQVVDIVRKAGSSISTARAAQITGLQQEKMSAERYAIVRTNVNRVLGMPNLDFAKAAEAIQKGQFPDLSQTVQPASALQQKLIDPYKQELNTTVAAGLLGL